MSAIKRTWLNGWDCEKWTCKVLLTYDHRHHWTFPGISAFLSCLLLFFLNYWAWLDIQIHSLSLEFAEVLKFDLQDLLKPLRERDVNEKIDGAVDGEE